MSESIVKNEIVRQAQRIVSRAEFNFGDKEMFHNTSAIYKISNERIQDYYEYFRNRDKALMVIASGDQILDSILEGVREIDAFDISVFPKYFMYLKMAAIKALNREEYLDFFYEATNRAEVYDDMYDRISEFLGEESKEFWDGLFNFFDWQDIYNSTLFSSEPYMVATAVNQNRYLQTDEMYELLRKSLDDVVIRTYEGDIFELVSTLNESYDLVYLSNIFYYNDANDYKRLLGDLRLTDKGIALTYVYRMHEKLTNFFDSEEYDFKKFVNTDAGIMIYHK